MSIQGIIRPRPYLVEKIWGGSFLNSLSPNSVLPVGESWVISTLEEGESEYQQKILSEVIGERLNYLVKLISTGDNLSVQVHPGDDYAKVNERTLGKTECWLILEAEKGAGIFLGLKPGITREHFEAELKQEKDLDKLLNFIPVKKGDFFFVPAGTVHSIGKGLLLLEVQQSSGVTYRVWDWNRVEANGKKRELHVKKAMDVISFVPKENSLDFFRAKNLWQLPSGRLELVIGHPHFHFYLLRLKAGEGFVFNEIKMNTGLICLEGEVSIENFESGVLKKLQTIFLPSPFSSLNLKASSDSFIALVY